MRSERFGLIAALGHNVVVLAGDTNSRLSSDLAARKGQPLDWKTFGEFDEIQAARAFFTRDGFVEAPIHFAPTYKFKKRGTDQYSTKRIPAWTDRILVRGPVRCLHYDAVSSVRQSDHRPVLLTFDVVEEDSADASFPRRVERL